MIPADLCDRIHRAAGEARIASAHREQIDHDLLNGRWPVLAETLDAASRFGGGPVLAALAAEVRAHLDRDLPAILAATGGTEGPWCVRYDADGAVRVPVSLQTCGAES